MKPFFFLIVVLCSFGRIYAQDTLTQVASIDPDSLNFSDLSFLRQALAGVNVVGLGEQSHGDGATFDAKIRLIKYLHENLGYNVIAFESGLYDCGKANDLIQAGKDAEEYLFKAIFGIWDCKQIKKLAAYLNETRQNGHPLLLAGFDCQFAGNFSKSDLINELNAFVREVELKTGDKINTDTLAFNEALRKVIKYSNFYTKLSSADTTILSSTISRLVASIADTHLTDARNGMWLRICHSILIDYRRKWPENNLRDSIMAENTSWLMDGQFKGQKIMIWAASAHIAYNTNLVEDEYLSHHITMGTLLKRKLDTKFYSIVFTSYQGKSKAGIVNLKVDRADANGIEEFFFSKGYRYAFTNLRSNADKICGQYGNSKIFGHRRLKMKLCSMADGVFYIENMTPAIY